MDIAEALKQGQPLGTRAGRRTLAGMMGLQVTMSVTLLSVCGLCVLSLRHVSAHSYGYDFDRLWIATVDYRGNHPSLAEIDDLFHRMTTRAIQLEGVQHSSVTMSLPF